MNDRHTFNRASLRDSGGRAGLNSLRPSFRASGAVRVSLSEIAKVHRATDLVRAKAEKHYEKHRETWVNRRFATLLIKQSNTLSLSPNGIGSDPKTALMARAGREIAARHNARLNRIEKARANALHGQPLRGSRKMQWGKGLGE